MFPTLRILEIEDPAKLVQWGIARGLLAHRAEPVKPSPSTEERRVKHREYMRALRARLYAQGLSSLGTPRKKQPRPQLAGLKPNTPEYHRAWYQLTKEAP